MTSYLFSSSFTLSNLLFGYGNSLGFFLTALQLLFTQHSQIMSIRAIYNQSNAILLYSCLLHCRANKHPHFAMLTCIFFPWKPKLTLSNICVIRFFFQGVDDSSTLIILLYCMSWTPLYSPYYQISFLAFIDHKIQLYISFMTIIHSLQPSWSPNPARWNPSTETFYHTWVLNCKMSFQ